MMAGNTIRALWPITLLAVDYDGMSTVEYSVASDYTPVAEGNTTTQGRVRTSPAAWS
jgi:hypothetical protein